MKKSMPMLIAIILLTACQQVPTDGSPAVIAPTPTHTASSTPTLTLAPNATPSITLSPTLEFTLTPTLPEVTIGLAPDFTQFPHADWSAVPTLISAAEAQNAMSPVDSGSAARDRSTFLEVV